MAESGPKPATIEPDSTTMVRHFQTLLRISRVIGTIHEIDFLIDRIMYEATVAFQADRSSLMLHDPERHQLWSRVAQGVDRHVEIRIPETAGLVGQVFLKRKPVMVSDTFRSAHFNRKLAERIGYVPRSVIAVPISHRRNRCEGVLEVMDKRVGYFTHADVTLLDAIAVQVAISLDNARLYEAQKRQFNSFVRSFSAALDARDPVTQEHSINVANNAMGIGYFLGLKYDDLEWLRVAGLLHDVGKIGTPEAILTKPGKLTDEEYVEMKRHAAHSRAILEQIEFAEELKDIPAIAPAHHEKLDGTGYPEGLQAPAMCLKTRILCVADICHALMQDRPYRAGMTVPQAMAILDKMTPHQLDKDCVSALKMFLGVLPPPRAGR